MKFAYFNPTLLAIQDVPSSTFADLKSMVDQAHQKSEYNDEGNQNISIRGGQQIQLVPNQFGLDTAILKEFIEHNCKIYIDQIVKTTGVNDLIGFEPCLISAWTIKQEAGDYQALHSHEAHISGNIYIDVPDLAPNSKSSDANIEFRFPIIRNPAHFMFTDQWRYTPQPMKMIMFPSHIPHTVYPWNGYGERTILAWDVRLLSKIENQ